MKKIFYKRGIAFLSSVLLLLNGCGARPTASSSMIPENSPMVSSATPQISSETSLPSAISGENARVADSYFNDAVFIGDSVSLKLKNYATQKRKSHADFLGKAQFLTAGSMGSGNALQAVGDKSIHPLVNGKKMSLPDGIATLGAKETIKESEPCE